ncbi:unnamed protein product [Bursaphelenchus xylophilus]|uniref:(pine wood nematode) hypothetical protein n=1 Tax=Bursaphelenchus xylophilus TaxID=6326 RepID=A0A1I7RTH3_BURXY|nr:unnamed protein product [Bursaphelenchus xylophilus]CAG9122450.1 unnamed protein product [Bursaphelenchus xylophilus]
MLFLLLIFILPISLADYTYYYEKPHYVTPFFTVKIGNDSQDVNVHFDLIRPFSYVFSDKCKMHSRCDWHLHYYIYNSTKTGGMPLRSSFIDNFHSDALYLKGHYFADSLNFGEIKLPLALGVVDEGNGGVNELDGVIGLGFDQKNNSIVKKLMKKLSVKQITVQEGHNNLQRPGKPLNSYSNGSITFGKYHSNDCGEFAFMNAMNNYSWMFVADVRVGNRTLKNQKIAFNFGRRTLIPTHIFKRYFPSLESDSEETFPQFAFTAFGKEYKTTKEDYSYYVPHTKGYMQLLGSVSHQPYDFAFGSDFLQNYCLALKEDDNGSLRIGLAENIASKKARGW